MLVYNYNTQLQPPAPLVHVTLRKPDSDVRIENLPALPDSAADRTVIPLSLVERLGLVQLGEARILPLVLIKAIANRGENIVLLGRDVLNHYRVLLDGPRLKAEIE